MFIVLVLSALLGVMVPADNGGGPGTKAVTTPVATATVSPLSTPCPTCDNGGGPGTH